MHVLPFVLRYGESRNESYVEINRKQRRHFALRSTSATAFALAWLAPKMSFQRYKLYYLLLHVGPAQTSDVLPIISDIRAHCTFVRTADHCSTAVTLRAHTSDAAATFVLLLSVHLFWLHSLIRVRFVIKTGILERSLTEIICAHFCSTPPPAPLHIPTQSVRTVWVRQTDRQVSRTLLPDEVNPSIIQLVHRSIISCHLPSLLPTHPHAPSHPSLFPHFPLPSLSMLLPLTPHSSREVQSGPTCTIHVTNPKQSSTPPGVSNKWCRQQLSVLCWRLDRTNGS